MLQVLEYALPQRSINLARRLAHGNASIHVSNHALLYSLPPPHSDPLHNLADSLYWSAHPHSVDSNFSVSDVVFVTAAAQGSFSGTMKNSSSPRKIVMSFLDGGIQLYDASSQKRMTSPMIVPSG